MSEAIIMMLLFWLMAFGLFLSVVGTELEGQEDE